MVVFSGRPSDAVIMQLVGQLQWTAARPSAGNLTFSFQEHNRVQSELTEKFILFFSTILHGRIDFQRSHITFAISNKSTFFGTKEKTNEK